MTHDSLQWERVLWDAGYRVTRQRAHILDTVCAAEGHTTLGEIYLRLQKVDPSIDRSTVYRALRLFVDLGLVLVAETGGSETYYEVARLTPHHHLICRSCGGEWNIEASTFEAMFEDVFRQHGFQVETDHLVLFGNCANCHGHVEQQRNVLDDLG